MPAIAIQMLLHKIRPSVVSKNAAQPVNRPRYNLKFPKKYDFYFLTIYDLKRYRCVNFFSPRKIINSSRISRSMINNRNTLNNNIGKVNLNKLKIKSVSSMFSLGISVFSLARIEDIG